MKKDCINCKHNIEMSEGDLVCAPAFAKGELLAWCDFYNTSIKEILSEDPELEKCEDFVPNE